MPRENSKCRQWEKERRNRLNEAISTLSKLLPNYDPAVNVGKIDIIKNAAVCIEDLQAKLKELLLPNKEKKVKDAEILRLQERIKKLLNKNEQLCYLLKQARISIPPGCISFKKFNKNNSLPWSNRITSEQAKLIQKNEAEKENSESSLVVKKQTVIKKSETTTTASTEGNKNKVRNKSGTSTPRHRKAILNRIDKKAKSVKFKKIINKNLNGSNCVIVLSQPSITQPCYVITNTPSNNFITGNNTAATTIITNSDILTNPSVMSNIKNEKNKSPTKTNNSTLSTLGPGTLILANGAVVPVLPQIPKIVTNPIITPNNPTVILVPRTLEQQQSSQLSTNKNIPIKPKPCLTHTTQVNKVPIPALTSRYANNLLVLNNNTSNKNNTNNKNNAESNNKIKIVENKKVVIEKKLKRKNINNNDDTKKKESKSCKRKLEEAEEGKCKDSNGDVKKLKITESIERNSEKVDLKDFNDEEQIVCSDSNIDDNGNEKDNIVNYNDKKTITNKINETTSETDNNEVVSKETILKNIIEPTIISTVETVITTTITNSPTTTSTSAITNTTRVTNTPITREKTIDSISLKKSKVEDSNEKSNDNQLETISNTSTATATCSTVVKAPTTTISSVTDMKSLELNISHSELSNDIFASLQVPTGCQNPESTSPTAAFLLAFPLVSSLTGVKVTEVTEEDNTEESQHGTPTLLQIGTMDTTKTTQSDSLTPSLLNLDNLSFFGTKDICNTFYNSFDTNITATCTTTTSTVTTVVAKSTEPVIVNTNKSMTSNINSNGTHVLSINKLNETKINLVTKIDDKLVNNNTNNNNKPKIISSTTTKICSNNLINNNNNNNNSHQNNIFENRGYSINFINNSNYLPETNNYQQQKLKQQQPSHLQQQPTQQQTHSQKPQQSHSQQHLSHPQQQQSHSQQQQTHPQQQQTHAQQQQPHPQQPQQQIKNNYNLTSQFPSLAHGNTKFNDLSSTVITTCSYITITKSYPDPLYTNGNSYMYSYPTSDTNFNQNYYKNITKNDNRSYYTLNYENYSDYKKNDIVNNFTGNNSNNSSNYTKDKINHNGNGHINSSSLTKSTNSTITTQASTRPINWMTTPDNRLHQTSDYMLTPFTSNKDNHFAHNSTIYPTNSQTTSYFNTNSSMYTSSSSGADSGNNLPTETGRKVLDLPLPPPVPTPSVNSYQRNEIIEHDNQFSWSPTKIPQFLDPQHSFVSSTLPTLVGDLALSNHLPTFNDSHHNHHPHHNYHQKNDTNKYLVKDKNRLKIKTNNYDNQNNFLSVSQLVDHNKSSDSLTTSTNRVNSRRNSSSSSNNRNNSTNKVPPKSSNKRKSTNDTNNKNLNDKNNHQLKHQLNTSSTVNGGGGASIYSNNLQISNEIFCENKLTKTKSSSSNYSAEALIGLHMQSSSDNNLQNKINKQSNYSNVSTKTLPPPVPFLTDNIIPYFPPVDLQQTDNNYIVQQNQNYHQTTTFSHNFSTSFQNNSYSSTSNNFMPSTLPSHDYDHDNLNLFSSSSLVTKENNNKNFNKNINRLLVSNRDDKAVQQNLCQNSSSATITTSSISGNTSSTIKKSSSKIRKQTTTDNTNTTNLQPNFVDFPFLSMPGTINSPILPDDFHVHTGFLQPPAPQLYSCKNPLYPSKQNPDLSSSSLLSLPSVTTRNTIQHADISPINNNNNNSAGTSLTNFNLSTIFPEINKGPLTDNYLEPRNNKDIIHRNFSSSVQVPFNDKPTFSLSYINCPTTQTYNNQ